MREVIAAAKWRPLKGEAVRNLVETGEHAATPPGHTWNRGIGTAWPSIGIESVAAVENLSRILEVPGIDGIFVGPNDMSISLGLPDQYDRPEYQETRQAGN